jgi:hypothetical protein
MLPQPQYLPAHRSKLPKIALIALTIATDLRFPKRRHIGCPNRKSISMPKVTINENGDFAAWENDIGFTR